MTSLTRIGSMLSLTALLAFASVGALTGPANAKIVTSKTVHVGKHYRLDWSGVHHVRAYTKTTRTVRYSGFTDYTRSGKHIYEPGYERKYTVIKHDQPKHGY